MILANSLRCLHNKTLQSRLHFWAQDKVMLIAVRGTAQIEDVVTDLTALPVVRASWSHLAECPCLIMRNPLQPTRGGTVMGGSMYGLV